MSKVEKPKKTQEKKKKKKCPECPCGGSQSCIVMRRYCNDWVHEDDLFKEKGVPNRENCYSLFTDAQQKVMDEFHRNMEIKGCHSITNRWSTEPV